MIIDTPGVYDLTMDEHHSDLCIVPSLSRSIIKLLISKSPAHARQCHPRLNPEYRDEHKKAYNTGSACHSLFLEGIDKAVVVEADSWRTNAAKAARDAAYDDDKIPLLREEYDEILEIVESAKVQLANSELGIKSLQDEGDSELSYFWEESGGIWCRTRPDWISKDRTILLDYKTTGKSANPSDFARNILDTAIDIQGALYSRGIEAVDGIEPRFVLVVQEIMRPYLCSFLALSPAFVEVGKDKMRRGMRIWKDCLESGTWPGYPNRICWLDCPTWAMNQWIERTSQDESDPTNDWGK